MRPESKDLILGGFDDERKYFLGLLAESPECYGFKYSEKSRAELLECFAKGPVDAKEFEDCIYDIIGVLVCSWGQEGLEDIRERALEIVTGCFVAMESVVDRDGAAFVENPRMCRKNFPRVRQELIAHMEKTQSVAYEPESKPEPEPEPKSKPKNSANPKKKQKRAPIKRQKYRKASNENKANQGIPTLTDNEDMALFFAEDEVGDSQLQGAFKEAATKISELCRDQKIDFRLAFLVLKAVFNTEAVAPGTIIDTVNKVAPGAESSLKRTNFDYQLGLAVKNVTAGLQQSGDQEAADHINQLYAERYLG